MKDDNKTSRRAKTPDWPEKDPGLLPVVVQDIDTGEVLMQAWVNPEALQLALKTGQGVYYSRSRQEIWVKGQSSGNRQRLLEVRLDCDGDSLLYLVRQEGPACHLGQRSCFFVSRVPSGDGDDLVWREVREDEPPPAASVLLQLAGVLRQRQRMLEEDPEDASSYVVSLLRGGVAQMRQKVQEEAAEVDEAAVQLAAGEVRVERLVEELADLWFHSLVLLQGFGGSAEDVLNELSGRFGRSGLDEKNSRKG